MMGTRSLKYANIFLQLQVAAATTDPSIRGAEIERWWKDHTLKFGQQYTNANESLRHFAGNKKEAGRYADHIQRVLYHSIADTMLERKIGEKDVYRSSYGEETVLEILVIV